MIQFGHITSDVIRGEKWYYRMQTSAKIILKCQNLRCGISFYTIYVNIRCSFAQLFRCKWQNVNSMLNKLDLQFVGRPHSGIDDSRNIAAIAYQVHRQRKLKPNMSI